MALKLSLKPGERMILGGAVVKNGAASSCELLIENRVPILREKDILTEEGADSPCRRIYYVIQLMYIDEENLASYTRRYWNLVHDVVQAAPSTLPLVDAINEQILQQRYYQALKLGRKLIAYEEEVLSRVSGGTENL